MALPKITTSVQFLEPQQDIPQTLPKIVFLSTEYEELYKANEPFYVYSQTDAVSKLTGQLYTKVIEQLDTFSTVDDVTGQVTHEAVVVPVEMALPKYLDDPTTVINPAGYGEVTLVSGTNISSITSNYDLNFGTNLEIVINHNSTNQKITQEIVLDKDSKYTGEYSYTAQPTGQIEIPINGLEGEKLSVEFVEGQLDDDFSETVQVTYYKKPSTIQEKILALEIALDKLEGYPTEYIIFDESSFGEFVDQPVTFSADDLADFKKVMETEGFKISSILSGDLKTDTADDLGEFYKYNDMVVRIADYCQKNSDQFRRVMGIFSAIKPQFVSYTQLKDNYQKLISLNEDETIQKIRETYGEYMVVNSIVDKQLKPMTNMVLRNIYQRTFDQSFFNIYLSSQNQKKVANIVPHKFAQDIDNAGYIFAKYDETFVVIPSLRTMDTGNKHSVRTVKLINNILNETRDIAKKYIGRPNSFANRTLLQDEITSNLINNYVTKDRIKEAKVDVRIGEISGSLGVVNVYMKIIDFYEIGEINIHMTYQKES